MIHTVGSIWPDTNIPSQGGLASHIRVHENFVFPIPDGLTSAEAAPMLCGGITAYSPLVSYGSVAGLKVGIIGLGGIGHFAVLWAKALGAAEVWVISRTTAKQVDAERLGCDGFIATNKEGWNAPHGMTFNLIVNTANSTNGFDFDRYLSLLDVRARFVNVGIPGGDGPPAINLSIMTMIANGASVSVSHIGNRTQILDMLQLAVDKGVKPWVEQVAVRAESLAKGIEKVKSSEARYKLVFIDYDKAFAVV